MNNDNLPESTADNKTVLEVISLFSLFRATITQRVNWQTVDVFKMAIIQINSNPPVHH